MPHRDHRCLAIRYPIYYTPSEKAGPGVTMVSVSTRSIAVTGMTCDHCASAVRAEISKLSGVTGVEVDVAAGTVRITGDPLPGDTPLREAVEEAGYDFAG
jgi:copper chaperone